VAVPSAASTRQSCPAPLEKEAEVRTRGNPRTNSLPSNSGSGKPNSSLDNINMAYSKVTTTGNSLETTNSNLEEMHSSMDNQYSRDRLRECNSHQWVKTRTCHPNTATTCNNNSKDSKMDRCDWEGQSINVMNITSMFLVTIIILCTPP